MSNDIVCADRFGAKIRQEVDESLEIPSHTNLECVMHMRRMKHYDVVDNTRILKTSFRLPNIANEDSLSLAVEDFNSRQSNFREEIEHKERWVVEKKIG